MLKNKECLADLVKEQQALQFNTTYRGVRTIRNRLLSDYSAEFYMPKEWLKTHLSEIITKQDKVVHVDLGCGDGVALTEALLLADSLKRNNLRAIGVDILPPDRRAIFPPYRKYQPEFRKDNIDEFTFPEAADLVTLCYVLRWTRDPLCALVNAAAQTKVGGIVCANNIDRILDAKCNNLGLNDSLFYGRREDFPGFQLQSEPSNDPATIVLKKVDEMTKPEEILQSWFGRIPQLISKKPTEFDLAGFYYHYI